MASDLSGHNLEKVITLSSAGEKPASFGKLQLVQTNESFDWINDTGGYANTLSDKTLKLNHTYFDNNVNLERVDTVTLGLVTPTFETYGELFFEPEELEGILFGVQTAEEFRKTYLTLGYDFKIKMNGYILPLGGYALTSSERLKSFGSWNDEDIDKKSISIHLVDDESKQSINLVYVESFEGKKSLGYTINIARDGKLFPIDVRQNEELYNLFLTVEGLHLRLRQKEARVLNYSDVNEGQKVKS